MVCSLLAVDEKPTIIISPDIHARNIYWYVAFFFLYIWYIPADILICTCEKRYDTYYDVSLYEYIYSLSEYIRINSTYDNADWHPTDIGMKYVCNAHTSIHGWMANGILRSRSFSWYKSRVAYITDEGNLLVLIIISFDN